MSGPLPKKGLGQNFLADKDIARDIVQAIDPKPDEVILEIGPGRGTITGLLLEKGAQVYTIEIDERLLEPLVNKFGSNPLFHLIQGDFLKMPWESMVPDVPFRLVGNLPYHISSSVIFRCLDTLRTQRNDYFPPGSRGEHKGGDYNRILQSWILMVQKEVAERIIAEPGSRDYGILSVFCALEGNAEILKLVNAHAFYPRPKVDGAVVRFTPHKQHQDIIDFSIFNKLVRGAFAGRRKMLRNSLKSIAGIHPFWQELNFDFTRRPETVSVEEWVHLANSISNLRNHK
jgi:16S rRNA (adenine1518-N6/adenine1519-N6)-dimethyltransferase